MDSLITAAARALAAGDPLGALKRVALRDDPPALALLAQPLFQREFMTILLAWSHRRALC